MNIIIKDIEEAKKERFLKRLMSGVLKPKKYKPMAKHILRSFNILEYVKEGKFTYKEIGNKFGITGQGVSDIAIRNGVRKNSVKHSISMGCKACGREILVPNYLIKHRKNFYCNKSCKKLFILQRFEFKLDANKNTCNFCKKNYNYILYPVSGYRYICRKCNSERSKNYRKTELGKIAYRKIRQRQAEKFKDKYLARIKLNYEISKGNLIKPKNCSKCGKKKKLDGHHSDYSKPLKVKWLCRQCHSQLHKELKNGTQ